MEKTKTVKKPSLVNRWLNRIERVGNKLPHPISLFAILVLAVILVSALCEVLGVSATGELVNRSKGIVEQQTVKAISLLNGEGFAYMITHAISNFTGFAPLGVVLVAMFGIGLAEDSGFIGGLLKSTVEITPAKLITPVIVFLGVMSNLADAVGYIVVIPIAALMYMAYGRHPMVGIAAAFAGVSGGFSANLLIGTLDPLLCGITNEAVKMVDPSYIVEPTGNWYFMIVSTFLITILGTIVTEKIISPRFGEYKGAAMENGMAEYKVTKEERKALKYAGLALVLMIVGMIALCIPATSFLRAEDGSILGNSPFMEGIIIIIAILFFVPSVIYGKMTGVYKGEKDVCAAMGKAMSSMGGYIALSFVAAQFINYFGYTKLGTILALKGAEFFRTSGIGPIPMMILFVLFAAFINLFMGSASAKWAIVAPVFVPMFMLLGYTPEFSQIAYRIGDSCTNVITPMMSYFAMIIVFAKKYDKDAGIGTLVSTMLPYSIVFLIGWTALLVVWIVFNLPLGPGVGMFL
ncbi:MAG: AbgT family transporter [Clostridium sp.]